MARHFAEAQTALGSEKLVRDSLVAGERALAIYAYEDALDYFRRALTAKEGQPMEAEGAALLFGIVQARAATLHRHEIEEVMDGLRKAFYYYVEVADVDRAIEVAEFNIPGAAGRMMGDVQMMARALKGLLDSTR